MTTAAMDHADQRTVVRARLPWLATGLAVLAAGVGAVAAGAGPWWVLAGAAVAPDLSFLAALGAPFPERGRLAPRAVPVYNLVHRPAGPAVLAFAGATGLAPAWTVVAGLGWLGHIAVDRASGYGLRAADGWQRG